jgi:hypothetical protein
MLMQNEVEIKWHGINKEHYIDKGYEFTNTGDVFLVKFEDVLPSCHTLIDLKCDYQQEGCKNIYQKRVADYYKNNINSTIHKDCCDNPNCMKLKRQEGTILKYGCDNVAQVSFIQRQKIKTCKEKYGGNSPICSSEVRQKSKETLKLKYNVENISQVDDIKKLKSETLYNNYGVTNPMLIESVKEKLINNNLEKYGTKYYTQTDEYKEKAIITNQNKYGVDWYLSLDEPHQKGRAVCLDKYGTEFPIQLKDIRNKARQTMYKNGTAPKSSQQIYIAQLYNGQLNYLINSVFLDIAFPEKNLYIEYNGSGHELQVKFGTITHEDFIQKERVRYYYLKNKGWNLIEIISRKDYIPSDSILLQMLDYAKSYISTGHSWIKFDIDNSQVITSQYIKFYDYRKLRKIKEKDLQSQIA